MTKKHLAFFLAFMLLIAAVITTQAATDDGQSSANDSGVTDTSESQFPPFDASADWGLAVHQPGAVDQKKLIEEYQAQQQGNPDLQYVFPPDDRWQVSPAEANVALVVSAYQGGDTLTGCTATFIGDRTLVTAAHCLYVHEFGGWAEVVAVAPGNDGDSSPYGVVAAYSYYVPAIYIDEGLHPSYDFGVIVLETADLGKTVGWGSLGVLPDTTLNAPDLYPITVGYPGDKQFGTQWAAQVSALDLVGDGGFTSQLDQYAGQSGSAIMRGSDRAIFGLVSVELLTDGQYFNISPRITESAIGFFTNVCNDAGCTFSYFIEDNQPPQPTPTQPPPQPTTTRPAPQPSPGNPDSNFLRTWERTDKPVKEGVASRTWIWGDGPNSSLVVEPYAEAPGGFRTVQYYDKSRMEDGSWTGAAPPWDVSNGLLAKELMSGQMQTGDSQFEQRSIALVNVAGDPNDPNGPTYASFTGTLNLPAQPAGTILTQRIDRAGQVTVDPSLAGQGITIGMVDNVTNHGIASPFWDFMNSSGTVYESGQYIFDALFENPYFATGRPITEPYWTNVLVGGTPKLVLIQCFERRCLTYTPANDVLWQVEMGNIGQHYYTWRYPGS